MSWRVSTPTVFVGEVIEVDLLMQSVNGFSQSVGAIDVVLDWDPALIRLVGNKVCVGGTSDGATCLNDLDCPPLGTGSCEGTCDADDTAIPCYTCSDSYNWVTSSFPNDSQLDGLNADCGPDTFCGSYTARPFNDGSAFYQSIKQVFCNGQQAPAPEAFPAPQFHHVTTLRFEALAAGVAQISMMAEATCSNRQKVCLRGGNLLQSCELDSDCGDRICQGGANDGAFCSDVSQCPGGACPAFCTACSESFCCTEDDNCSSCSFANSRVLSAVPGVADITGTLGPAVLVEISDCQPPSVSVDGSRYLNVTPPPGTDPVAIRVSGVGGSVSCISKYVGADGQLGDIPVYMTPDQWMSGMIDAFNDPTDPTVHVRGEAMPSGETYAVQMDCSPSNPGTNFSDPVEGTLWFYGDTNGDGARDISDVVRALDGFSGVFFLPQETCTTDADCTQNTLAPRADCNQTLGLCVWVTRENVDLHGIGLACQPDRSIDIVDALFAIEGFQGLSDQCSVSCP